MTADCRDDKHIGKHNKRQNAVDNINNNNNIIIIFIETILQDTIDKIIKYIDILVNKLASSLVFAPTEAKIQLFKSYCYAIYRGALWRHSYHYSQKT